MRRPRMAAAVMLRTPAQLCCTSTALCVSADGSNISSVCASFIASSPNSEALRPQGCKAAIAPRARRGNHAPSARMTCGIDNMCCAITIIPQVAVDVVGLLRLNVKVDCSSGAALVNRWVYIYVAWHTVTSLSGKVIGVVSCVPSVERTSPNARVSECVRRGADGLLSDVHPGRCFPDAPTGPWFDRPRMSIRQRPNAPHTSTPLRTTRPPGARTDMI